LQTYWGRLKTASVSNAFWHARARAYSEGSVKGVGSFPRGSDVQVTRFMGSPRIYVAGAFDNRAVRRPTFVGNK
jgi:hypothetical protein